LENLIIKNRGQLVSRKTLGAIWIGIGIISILTAKSPVSQKDLMVFIIFLLIGTIHFTPLVGSEISKVEICEGYIKIIWFNWIRKVTIQESEIVSILLAQNGISVKRKDKKPVKIKFIGMNMDQRIQINEFFTEYSKQRNFIQDK
jgi:hypothetical protein